MSDNIEAIVAKSGETCIQTSISRSTDGLMINIWAQPRVEDFIRSLGSGERLDIQTIGRYWESPEKRDDAGKRISGSNKKLYVYDYSNDVARHESCPFRLDCPGSPLSGGDDGGIQAEPGRLFKSKPMETLNMSFLRLCGISEPGGVSFTVKGVYTREGITRLGTQIEGASKRFYREFLKPYRLIVTVSTMPIPEGF